MHFAIHHECGRTAEIAIGRRTFAEARITRWRQARFARTFVGRRHVFARAAESSSASRWRRSHLNAESAETANQLSIDLLELSAAIEMKRREAETAQYDEKKEGEP